MKVRGKYTSFSNKNKNKSKNKSKKKMKQSNSGGTLYNPYGVCKAAVMRGMSPKKNIPCGIIYDFNRYNMRELKAYALEKHMPIRHKGRPMTRKMLITRLRNKATREKTKLKGKNKKK
tara:strand:+ start:812 stop:1165 length:354 start_codon:yes stop_codon:yes gene_type:complete